MELYEDFVKDLLKSNIIKDNVASIQKTRNFYNNNSKIKSQYPFEDFADDLWWFWYISYSTRKNIHFDEKWIAYLSKEVADSAQNVNKKEEHFFNLKECSLCGTKFGGKKLYEEHKKNNSHHIRVQYVTDKSVLSKSDDLILKVIEVNNKSIADQNDTIQLESRTNVNITIQLQNASKTKIQIREIIQVNLLISNFTMHGKYESDSWLQPNNVINIVLNGYFDNSMDFLFPIVIVTGVEASKEKKNILKEIPIEVKSEFSSLNPEKIFIKKSKLKHIQWVEDAIVAGKGPPHSVSLYKESLPLKSFKINSLFEKKIKDLISIYPMFIEKDVAGRYNGTYARILGIDPVLSQTNYCNLIESCLNIEEIQLKIDIREYDMESKLRVVNNTSLYDLQVPGLAEARPSLLVQDSVYLKLNKDDSTKYQGIVHQVLEKSVHLGFNHRFSSIFAPTQKYFVEFGFNRRPIRVQKQAVSLVKQHDILPYLFPTPQATEEYHNDRGCLKYFNTLLNEEQQRAVINILNPNLKVPYIIFGPPGTGKTVTVVEAILQIWKTQPSSRILVCAPSNAATNEVALRLIGNIPDEDIFRLIGNIYSHGKELTKMKNIINIQQDGTFYQPPMKTLLKRRILLSTNVTAARIVNGGVPAGHFSHVFIDESGYATESESLIPIAGIVSNAANAGTVLGRVVLAGDPRQLGPVVHSTFAKFCGYAKSMLERLLDTCELYARNDRHPHSYNEQYVTKLLRNYRSHETIMRMSNKIFYHDELIAMGNEYTHTFIDWTYLKSPKFPVIFHHVEGEDVRERNSPSFFNVQEIEEVAGYLSKLTDTYVNGMKITPDHIGVITPYRKQAEKLRQAFAKKWSSVLVGSVEQFQGKEKLVIIISIVRSKNMSKFENIDKKCHLGFVKNPKRFNVALTRAKALMIVIGNAHVLKEDKNWLSFIKYCHGNNSVAGKPFELDDNGTS